MAFSGHKILVTGPTGQVGFVVAQALAKQGNEVWGVARFSDAEKKKVLEAAGLVVYRREGREKLHFLNPVPIRLIHDRWIDKYAERRVAALSHLKTELEVLHDDHD